MIHNLNVSKSDNHPIPQNFQKKYVFWKKIEQKTNDAKGKFKNKI